MPVYYRGLVFESEAERLRFRDQELIRMDRESALQGAYEDGYKEGLEEARREYIARALEQHSVAETAHFLGLSEDYIQSVADRVKSEQKEEAPSAD